MKDKRKTAVIATVAIAALAAGGTAVATARGGGDDDASEKPITGQTLERASSIALEHAGGGKVTGTEAGDEEGAYEVEVTRADGSEVDVHLDKDLAVLDSSAEAEGSEEDAD
jgi:uncharacterized membrane protein YkoI